MIKNDPFDELVGQKQVKKHLNELLRNFYAGAIVPHALIVAPKGCGKTEIGTALASRASCLTVQELRMWKGSSMTL